MALAASDALLPVRILAGIALIAVISCAFVYVLRHLRQIEKMIVSDELVPKELGPRNNVVLMIRAIPIIVVALLLYLIVNA